MDGGIIPSIDGNDDEFHWGDISDVPLATLFDEEFPIEGWNAEATEFQFDIA